MRWLIALPLFCFILMVSGHARIRYPRPLAAPTETPAGNYYNGPLRADGSDFPCKGLHKRADVDKTPTATWQAGEEAYFEVLGHGPSGGEGNLAAHSGGSCQASISFDNGETWKVLHSFIGGCPRGAQLGSNMASKDQIFRFLVPENTTAGDALFSWSWIAVTGNRNEFYQNCASVRIHGSGDSTLDDLPDMFLGDMSIQGHIGSGECRSTAGYAIQYPDPGEALTTARVSNIGFKAPTRGKCYTKASINNRTTPNPSSSTVPPSASPISLSPTKSDATTTRTLPTASSMATMITVSLPSGSLPFQCTNYMIITDRTRHTSQPSAIGCDKNIFKSDSVPTWVRFSGGAGTRIVTGPTEPFRCGTQGAGWYSGTYPSSVGSTVSGKVCFSWPGSPCQWSNTISITNCNGYYVFALPAPPACYLRYCTA